MSDSNEIVPPGVPFQARILLDVSTLVNQSPGAALYFWKICKGETRWDCCNPWSQHLEWWGFADSRGTISLQHSKVLLDMYYYDGKNLYNKMYNGDAKQPERQ